MTDLEELEEISDSIGFVTMAGWGSPKRGRNPPSLVCGSGHPWTEETTRMRRQNKRWRRFCRLCDRERSARRHKEKPNE